MDYCYEQDCPQIGPGSVAEIVAQCAFELREFWTSCVSEGDLQQGQARYIVNKFGAMGPAVFTAALLNPPKSGPPPFDRCAALAAEPAQFLTAQAEKAVKSDFTLETPPPRPSRSIFASLYTPSPLQEGESPPAVAEIRLALPPEMSTDCTFAEVKPSILRTGHQSAEHVRPDGEAIALSLDKGAREKVILWLLQVCGLRCLDDAIFHTAALLLDRYLVLSHGRVDVGNLHLTVMAIFSISMKLNGGADECTKPRMLRELLQNLGRGQYSVQGIFACELEVLKALGFNVSSPSPLDFVEAFVAKVCGSTGPAKSTAPSPVAILSRFLLQLSLLNPELHYKYSHAVLAAGAVYAALWCTRANPERMVFLLAEVGLCHVDARLETALVLAKGFASQTSVTDPARGLEFVDELAKLARCSPSLANVLQEHAYDQIFPAVRENPRITLLLQVLLLARGGEFTG